MGYPRFCRHEVCCYVTHAGPWWHSHLPSHGIGSPGPRSTTEARESGSGIGCGLNSSTAARQDWTIRAGSPDMHVIALGLRSGHAHELVMVPGHTVGVTTTVVVSR
jgi:hypothetical protein